MATVVLNKSKPLAIREKFGLTRAEFARMMQFSERALADWETGKQKASDVAQQQYAELERLHEGLSTIMDSDPESMGAWFRTPNTGFGDLPPLVIVEQAQIDRIWRMIFQLGSGGPT